MKSVKQRVCLFLLLEVGDDIDGKKRLTVELFDAGDAAEMQCDRTCRALLGIVAVFLLMLNAGLAVYWKRRYRSKLFLTLSSYTRRSISSMY